VGSSHVMVLPVPAIGSHHGAEVGPNHTLLSRAVFRLVQVQRNGISAVANRREVSHAVGDPVSGWGLIFDQRRAFVPARFGFSRCVVLVLINYSAGNGSSEFCESLSCVK
jgi:hypothetical protein